MDFTEYESNPGKRFIGLAVVIFMHVFIVYALVTGLARKVVEVIKQPIETKIIEEVKPPPPPDLPPPPPPKLLAPPPPFIPPPQVRVQQPPPPFIPPPEVQIQQPQPQNTITAVSNVKPDNPVMPPVVRSEAPAVGAVLVPAVVDARNCDKPEYPRTSLRNEESGTVTLAFLIGLDGRVVESRVEKSSGSKDLDNAARAGLSLCKFKPGTIDGKPQQSWTKMQYVWKLE
jgi:protein TonB